MEAGRDQVREGVGYPDNRANAVALYHHPEDLCAAFRGELVHKLTYTLERRAGPFKS